MSHADSQESVLKAAVTATIELGIGLGLISRGIQDFFHILDAFITPLNPFGMSYFCWYSSFYRGTWLSESPKATCPASTETYEN